MPDFTFNASALGAGGVIERGNVTYTIPSLASVALAPTGGDGRTVVSNYWSEELSFSHAETRVFGRETTKEMYTTSTNVLMKDVNVLNKLMVGEMRAVITSTRGLDGGDDHEFEIEASYDGVRVGRSKAFPRIDVRLKRVKTYEQLGQFLSGNAAAAGLEPPADEGALARRFNANSTAEITRLILQKKPVQGSLVEHVEGLEKAPVAPTIFVPGLGSVRFAELMYKPGRRRLNLIRIMFGPQKHETEGPRAFMMMAEESPHDDGGPTGGSMTLGSGEGNGAPVEP
jgi:hypothetical protein